MNICFFANCRRKIFCAKKVDWGFVWHDIPLDIAAHIWYYIREGNTQYWLANSNLR